MKESRKPILVTGSHRSGTTWAGKNLALAPNTGYIHEPFNIDIHLGVVGKPFRHWFQYISDENFPGQYQYKEALDRVIGYRYPLLDNLARNRTLKGAKRIWKDQKHTLIHKMKSNTPIVKDPIAFFSADWLARRYDMNVLVMIRHPAAFCSSLKIKKWAFNFNNFLAQPLLMERYLSPFEDEIRACAQEEKDIIDQGILLWNCIHHTVAVYQREHPEWVFARHEDLSSDPEGYFESIFQKFELDFTPEVKAAITQNSGSHNPAEQQADDEFKRDSKKNITNWKTRLSAEEIAHILDKTRAISSTFYLILWLPILLLTATALSAGPDGDNADDRETPGIEFTLPENRNV